MGEHRITIENKKKIIITEVIDVDAFDEETLWANLQDGGIEITGEKLNIERLELQEGILVITGEIWSITYTNKVKSNQRGLFKKKKAAK